MAGGAQRRIPVYDTEGGWLHLKPGEVVENALAAKSKGFRGVKIKIGRPHVAEDVARLSAVRKALGPAFDIMTDANQGFTVSEAIRRARHYEALDVLWFEEPLPAEDLNGHVLLSRSTSMPIAIGESLYHPSHFREYLQRGACNIVQVDVGRVGGITPWLKVAHLAETFNVQVCPHYPDGDPSGAVLRSAQRDLAGAHPAARRHHDLAHRHAGRLRAAVEPAGSGHRVGLESDRAAPQSARGCCRDLPGPPRRRRRRPGAVEGPFIGGGRQ